MIKNLSKQLQSTLNSLKMLSGISKIECILKIKIKNILYSNESLRLLNFKFTQALQSTYIMISKGVHETKINLGVCMHENFRRNRN